MFLNEYIINKYNTEINGILVKYVLFCFLDMINYNDNEKENNKDFKFGYEEAEKNIKKEISDEDLDQICLDNINDLLY